MKNNFKVIGFDADDTLWNNEPYFRQTEATYFELMKTYASSKALDDKLFINQMKNLDIYGYGIKAYTLSMIETTLEVMQDNCSHAILSKVLELGKEMLSQPVELLEGVVKTLDFVAEKGIRMIVITKGDLLDQERKLKQSMLSKYFHHVEVVSYKREQDYEKLLQHLDINPDEFLMVGNSLKSDILPVVNLGGYGLFVPYETTWQHEVVDDVKPHPNWIQADNIAELVDFLQ